MKRLFLAFVGLLALSSCSIAPITIDLLPMLGENASGSENIVATGELDLRLPDDEGETISGYETIQFKPSMVNLNYELDISQDGNLQGSAEIAFYLTSPGGDLWDSTNMIGEAQQIDLSQNNQSISGTINLNSKQIDALMAGEITIGAKLSGDVTGSATVNYEFKQFILKIAFF